MEYSTARNDDVPKNSRGAFIRIERKRRVNMIVATSLSENCNQSSLEEKCEIDVDMPIWTKGIMPMFPHYYT